MKSYKIAYKGLENGRYTFDFEVDKALFQTFAQQPTTATEHPKLDSTKAVKDDQTGEILDGDCSVSVELWRNDSFLQCDIAIEGSVDVECDRCLEPCPIEIDYEDSFVVKFTDDDQLNGEWDGDIMWLSTGQSELDLTQYIYESILLALPYQRVHNEGECNADMTERFKQISYEELEQIEKESLKEEEQSLDAESIKKLEALKANLIK